MGDITLAQVREKYPQYKDLSDEQLAGALHTKFYADLPKEEFYTKIGAAPQKTMGVLPEWAQTAHSYLDPNRVFAGKAGQKEDLSPVESLPMLSMAIPASGGKVRAPTEKQLMDAGGAGYDFARSSPISMNGGALGRKMLNFQAGLRKAGQGPTVAPKTNAILDDLQKGIFYSDKRNLSAGDYLDFRKALQNRAQDAANPEEALAATKAINRLDNLWDTTSPLHFSGASRADIDAVRSAIKTARDNFSAGFRSRTLTNKQDAVDLQANAANSGLNVDNKIRSKMGQLLNPDTPSGTSRAGRSGYSKEEMLKMRRINEGGVAINAARDVGNMLGGGGGIGRVVSGGGAGATIGGGLGFAVGGPPGALTGAAIGGAVAPTIGYGLKLAENAAARRALDNLASSVRLRSPLGAAATPDPFAPGALAVKLLSLSPEIIGSQ